MPVDQVQVFYLTQGVLGITVVALSYVLYHQDKRHREDIRERDNRIAELQEKRNTDTNIYADKFITTSTTLLNQFKDLFNLEVANQKSLDTIANILQNLPNTVIQLILEKKR